MNTDVQCSTIYNHDLEIIQMARVKEWIKLWSIATMRYYSTIYERQIFAFYYNLDDTRGSHVNQNRGRMINIGCFHSHMGYKDTKKEKEQYPRNTGSRQWKPNGGYQIWWFIGRERTKSEVKTVLWWRSWSGGSWVLW